MVIRGDRRGCFVGATLATVLLVTTLSCAPEGPPLARPPIGSTVNAEASKGPVSNAPTQAHRQMIVTAHPLASQAGLAVLRAGGSALDAAIAAQMVLNVVEPQHSGIGGGGFLLYFDAGSRTLTAYDGRETAPASARPEMFLDAGGKPRDFYDAVVGGLSVGVPGLVRMLASAHRDEGHLPWKALFQPAIDLATDGFPVSPDLHRAIVDDRYLRDFPDTRRAFYDSDGQPWAVGAQLINPALAATLRQIAEKGADAFYTGAIAADIARTVREAPRHPAVLTEADMATYRAVKREAICQPYRIWRICGMPPPTSGGIATLQILGLLEPFDLGAPESLEGVHLVIEASRLAFADRDRYLADPDFVPVAALLDPMYLAERRRLITERAARGPVEPGQLGDTPLPSQDALGNIREDAQASTTHLSIIDASGNAVALTSSIENPFGSRLMVRGFLLNNELTDFSFLPEQDGVPVANRPEPGKRPRSSMAPTLVFNDRGRVVMAVGSPGGPRIIGYVIKTLVGALDWGLNVQQAVDLPNFVTRNGPTELETATPLVKLQDPLERLGHTIVLNELKSGIEGIVVTLTGLEGGADHRRDSQALGD